MFHIIDGRRNKYGGCSHERALQYVLGQTTRVWTVVRGFSITSCFAASRSVESVVVKDLSTLPRPWTVVRGCSITWRFAQRRSVTNVIVKVYLSRIYLNCISPTTVRENRFGFACKSKIRQTCNKRSMVNIAQTKAWECTTYSIKKEIDVHELRADTVTMHL